MNAQDRVDTKFYGVVGTKECSVLEDVEIDSPMVCSVPIGCVLEIADEAMTASGHRRGRLADGQGWISIVHADGSVVMRECMRPFVAGAPVLPGETRLRHI